MQYQEFYVADTSGRALPGAQVKVYQAGTNNKARLFQRDKVTPLSNPFSASTLGLAGMACADGEYDVELQSGSLHLPPIKGLMFFDGLRLQDTLQAKVDAAEEVLEAYGERNRGALPADPKTRPSGKPNQAGDLYFNTTEQVQKTFNGASWYVPSINTALLASSQGASNVGVGSEVGGVRRTAADKFRELPSILDKGGKGDFVYVPGQNPSLWVGTNNVNALSQWMFAGAKSLPITVRFPFIPGQTNGYLLDFPSGVTFAAGMGTIDADEGVVLYVRGVVLNCEFTRPTRVVGLSMETAVSFTEPGGRDLSAPEVKKSRWFNAADAIAPVHRMLVPANDVRPKLIPWDKGGADGAIADDNGIIALGAQHAVFSTAKTAADGAMHIGFVSLRAGEELSAAPFVPPGDTGSFLIALVRTARGYHGALFGQGTVDEISNLDGSGATHRDASAVFGPSHITYYADGSIVTIRQLSAFEFQIMVNGYVHVHRTLSEPLAEVGFGTYVRGPTSVTWKDWCLAKGRPLSGARAISVMTHGDSISDSTVPQYSRDALEGTSGIRIIDWINMAVAGEDSTAQLARLKAHGVPAHVQFGEIALCTNDIQNPTAPEVAVSNISAMVDIYEAAGVPARHVSLIIPPLFYSRAIAKGKGQETRNYSGGTPMRNALLRLAASRGMPVLDSLPAYGPIVGTFLTDPLWSKRNAAVEDNIHFGSYMKKVMGYERARMLYGMMANQGTNEVTWRALPAQWPVQSGWAISPAGGARYMVDANGARTLEIIYDMARGIKADGTAIHVFGTLMRPQRPKWFDVYTEKRERALAILSPNGTLMVYGLQAATGVTLRFDTGKFEVT